VRDMKARPESTRDGRVDSVRRPFMIDSPSTRKDLNSPWRMVMRKSSSVVLVLISLGGRTAILVVYRSFTIPRMKRTHPSTTRAIVVLSDPE